MPVGHELVCTCDKCIQVVRTPGYPRATNVIVSQPDYSRIGTPSIKEITDVLTGRAKTYERDVSKLKAEFEYLIDLMDKQ